MLRTCSLTLLLVALVMPCRIRAQGTEVAPNIEELRKFALFSEDKYAHRKRERARERFPLTEERVRQLLAQAITLPMSVTDLNGLAVVLSAQGADGFLWVLEQVRRNDGAAFHANLIIALREFPYREALGLYISLLDDKRQRPPFPGASRSISYFGPPQRICDMVIPYLGLNLGQYPIYDKFPEGLSKLKGTISADPIGERDEAITQLRGWWAKEGERLAMEKRPSFIDDLLKKPKAEAEKKPANEGEKPK